METQPDRIKTMYLKDYDDWKSEREWVQWVRSGGQAPVSHRLEYYITDKNITHLEKSSCEKVITEAITVFGNKIRKHCCIYLSLPVNTSSGYDLAYQALTKNVRKTPDYSCCYNILYQMGIQANVTILRD